MTAKRRTQLARLGSGGLIASVLLVACGGGSATPSAATPASTVSASAQATPPPSTAAAWPQDYKGTTLNFIGEATTQTEVLKALIPDFTAKTGIAVNVDEATYTDITQKLVLGFTTHNSEYDVFSMPNESIGGFAEKQYISSIDDYLANPKFQVPGFDSADIIPALWTAASKWGGKTYGFASESPVMMYFYRKDLFADPGEQTAFKANYGYDLAPAQTWQQYHDIAEFFVRKSGSNLAGQTLDHDFFGAVSNARRDQATLEWKNYLWSFGGTLFDASGNLAINSDAAVASLEYWKSLIPSEPVGASSYSVDEVIAAMQQGTAAQCICWGDTAPAMEDATNSKIAGKTGYASNPVLKTGDPSVGNLGPWTYAINSDTKSKDAAYLFLAWALSKDVQVKLSQMGGYPAIVSALQDPGLISKYPQWTQLLKSLSEGRAGPRFPEWPGIADAMGLGLSNALTGQASPKDALDSTQSQILNQFKSTFPVVNQ